jgi:hypothetical protein
VRKRFNNTIFKTGLLFSGVMLFFLFYANSSYQLSFCDFELVKSKELQFKVERKSTKKKPKRYQNKVENKKIVEFKVDTTHKRFLLIGDSQVGGLMYPFYNYCKYNGHDLAFAQVWYSARDVTYADNDTLKLLIEKYKPDHIVMVIGLNQVYQDRFSKSEEAIEKIHSAFDTIPYTWIGPASWIPDNGITEFYKNNLFEGCFFASDKLVLDRGSDGRHPSASAYYVWMDSIAQWMQNISVHHIQMKKPIQFNTHYKFAHRSFNAGRKKNNTAAESRVDTSTVKMVVDSLNN